MNLLKRNYKVIIGLILGVVLTGSITYAATISSKDVTYSNTLSGLSSTNMQGAIDEVYTKAKSCSTCPKGYVCNEIKAYTYNSSSCITGEESTCIPTECYKNKVAGSCPAGTIIKYKVNDIEEHYFHVLHDDGETITMQQRENTVYNVKWYSSDDNTKGPIIALAALESATSSWTNVESQTYTMGTTVLYNNKFTGCTPTEGQPLSCAENKYTIESRTAKARMITGQETAALGCKYASNRSCPNWMNNYLYNSTSYGGTVNDNTKHDGSNYNYGYWTMSASSSYVGRAFHVECYGRVGNNFTSGFSYGARAVIVVSKDKI